MALIFRSRSRRSIALASNSLSRASDTGSTASPQPIPFKSLRNELIWMSLPASVRMISERGTPDSSDKRRWLS